jgi:hypothetical protein
MNTMKEPNAIIDEGFRNLDARLAELRLTARELVEMSDTSYPTYWRCRPRDDGYGPLAGINSRKRCLAALERALAEYERRIAQKEGERA